VQLLPPHDRLEHRARLLQVLHENLQLLLLKPYLDLLLLRLAPQQDHPLVHDVVGPQNTDLSYVHRLPELDLVLENLPSRRFPVANVAVKQQIHFKFLLYL